MGNDKIRLVALKDVALVNPDLIDKTWPYKHISYVDISSVGEGFFNNEPKIIDKKEAPSRAKRRVRIGDTVLSTVRPNRRSMFFVKDEPKDWIVSTGFSVIRPKKEIVSPRYLYYCVFDKAFTEYLVSHEMGAAYPAVSVNDILNAQIPLPSKKKQEHIVDILGSLDDKIELNRQMSKSLEEIAQALFKSWFVDFEPVHAKAAGEKPQGLSPEIAELFPDSFIDSEIGKIPSGWKTRKIGNLAKIAGGTTPRTNQNEYWEPAIHSFCTPKDMSGLSSPIIDDTARKVSDSGLAKISSGLLPLGTVLLSSRAPIGYLAITNTPICINQGIIAISEIKELSNYYFLHWLKENTDLIISKANGSTFLEIGKSVFRTINILVPEPKIMEAYNKEMCAIFNQIKALQKESKTLQELLDVLLPRLIEK